MRTQLYLKSSAELISELEARMTDTGNALATDTQYLAAINEAIRLWDGRVAYPQLYNLPDGFSTGTYEYVIPNHVRPPFRVQIRSNTYSYLGTVLVDNDNNYTWHYITGYQLEPDGDGGFKLRLSTSPSTETARIVWYAGNPTLPSEAIEVNQADFGAASTSVIIEAAGGAAFFPPPQGFIRIEDEYIGYDTLTNGPTTSYTLSGLTRGLQNSVAAAHASAAVVYFCVAVDDQRLWTQMYDQCAAYVHGLQMHKSTIEDISRHEKLLSFFQAKADNFWRQQGYVSQRQGRMINSPGALGTIAW